MSEPLRSPVAEVILLSQDTRDTLVVVEGSLDWRALEPHFEDNVVLYPLPYGYGRNWVMQCIRELNLLKRINAIGIADSDFGNILGKEDIANLFYTEFHDLMIDILQTGVLRRVCPVIVSREKLEQFAKKSGHINLMNMSKLSEILAEESIGSAAQIGIVKLACHLASNHMESVGSTSIDMDRYGTGKYIVSFLGYDAIKYLEAIEADYPNHDIQKMVEQEKQKRHDSRDLANDHDVLKLICESVAFFCLGNFKGNVKSLTSVIMSAFHLDEFKKISLYRDLTQWEMSRERKVIKR